MSRTGTRPPRLGIRANLAQFSLLVAVNALVGGMVGQERTVVPLLATRIFHLQAFAAALSFIVVFGAVKALTNLFAGTLSDRFGRKPLYLAGAVVTTLWAFPLFGLMDTKSPALIALAIVVGVNIGHDLMYGPQGAYFSELFGTRVRYSGASLGYQLASVFAGGFAPLIATALLAAGGSSLVALYVVAMGLISVVATLAARETLGTDFERDEEPELELVRERRFDRERFAERETAGTR